MCLFGLLQRRRSKRNLSQKSISDDILRNINNIILFSPTSGGLNSNVIKTYNNEVEKDIVFVCSGFQDVVLNAGCLFLVGSKDFVIGKKYSNDFLMQFSCQNATILAYNIILYLTEQGIDSCFVGTFYKKMLVEKLKLEFNPWCIVCAG